MIEIILHELFGERKFFIWMKKNELYEIWHHTEIAGHWSAKDVAEFKKANCIYEIHLHHSQSQRAATFCSEILQRCADFKSAKLTIVAFNDVKVIALLCKSSDWKNQVARAAKEFGFSLERVRSKDEIKSEVEENSKSKFNEYMRCLKNAFAPMAGIRVERRD